MHVRYDGPSALTFPTLRLVLEPGEAVEVDLDTARELHRQLSTDLALLDEHVVLDTPAVKVVEYEDTPPAKTTVTFRADFAGSVTVGEGETAVEYQFDAGEAFEVEPDHADELAALDLGEQSFVNVDAAEAEADDADLSDLRKAELQALARDLGLSDEGTVAELRERIDAHRTERETPDPEGEPAAEPEAAPESVEETADPTDEV